MLLVKYGITGRDFSLPIEVILSYYDKLTTFLFGWIGESIELLLKNIFDIHIGLDKHWKDIFVLLWLYFGGDAKNAWGGDWEGANKTAIVRFLFGGVFALLGALLAGSIKSYPALYSGFQVLFPSLALVLYRLWFAYRYALERAREGFERSSEFWGRASMALEILFVCLPFIVIGFSSANLNWLPTLPNLGLALLTVLIVLLASYHIFKGAFKAQSVRGLNESWFTAFSKQGNTTLGVDIYKVIAGATLFLLCNAGLEVIS